MTQGEIEKLTAKTENIFSELEIRIMSDIVRRIKENNFSTATADWQVSRLQQLGITDGGEVVGFFSPPHKTPTGKRLEYSTFRHPLATDHWDKAMMTARKEDLVKSYEEYLKRR